MSDIVERLRQMADHDANDYAIGHYWNAVEEAADEIERQAKSIEDAMTQLAWKDDEIERLRHDYAELATRSVVAAKNAVVPYQMEIERLTADRDSWAQQADDRVKDCEGFIAEIERLREVARKLFIELEGDDQHFDVWLAKQGDKP